MNTLVVPTARPPLLLEFLEQWRPWPWNVLIVVEDGPEVTIDAKELAALADGRGFELFSWTEIDAELPAPWIISMRAVGISDCQRFAYAGMISLSDAPHTSSVSDVSR